MVYSRELVEQLEMLGSSPLQTRVYRHMFGDYLPDRENITGSRWNPPNTRAIYCGMTRDACLAEANHYITVQPSRPNARRMLYEIEINLSRVVTFPSWDLLRAFGADRSIFSGFDHAVTWEIGGAVAWLDNDALMIPSARCDNSNLVIYPENQLRTTNFQ
tara:strand:+ start:396 stop:875 length:480 start_codon:yes stop_codon:yes gene_type:complete